VVASSQRRGAEVFAADLVRHLDRAGIEQRVVALRGARDPVPFDAPLQVLGPEDRPASNPRLRVGAIRALRSAIRSWSPGVVHVHGGEPLKYATLACAGGSFGLLYRKIGAAPTLTRRSVRWAGHAALLRRADIVVAVAECVRREALEVFGLPEHRVVTIPNAVDAARLTPAPGRDEARRALQIPTGADVVLFLGSLSEEKAPLDIVEIAHRVRRQRPEVLLLMAGDGPMRAAVQGAVVDRGLERNVRILGSRADVSTLLSACDVVGLTSRTEGMPGVVIEAGLACRPVVGYAVGGVPEVVVHGATGLLTVPGELEGVSRALRDLFESTALRDQMGAAARERCLGSFEMGTVAPRYLDLYQHLG
jgi:glycosyltransferase involved in cell wall biosynthesis